MVSHQKAYQKHKRDPFQGMVPILTGEGPKLQHGTTTYAINPAGHDVSLEVLGTRPDTNEANLAPTLDPVPPPPDASKKGSFRHLPSRSTVKSHASTNRLEEGEETPQKLQVSDEQEQKLLDDAMAYITAKRPKTGPESNQSQDDALQNAKRPSHSARSPRGSELGSPRRSEMADSTQQSGTGNTTSETKTGSGGAVNWGFAPPLGAGGGTDGSDSGGMRGLTGTTRPTAATDKTSLFADEEMSDVLSEATEPGKLDSRGHRASDGSHVPHLRGFPAPYRNINAAAVRKNIKSIPVFVKKHMDTLFSEVSTADTISKMPDAIYTPAGKLVRLDKEGDRPNTMDPSNPHRVRDLSHQVDTEHMSSIEGTMDASAGFALKTKTRCQSYFVWKELMAQIDASVKHLEHDRGSTGYEDEVSVLASVAPGVVPASKIPEEYHVSIDDGSGYDKPSLTVFPAPNPTSRVQVYHLARTLDGLLHFVRGEVAKETDELTDDERKFNLAQTLIYDREVHVWDTVLMELVRGVYAQCSERGILLEKCRMRYKRMVNRLVHENKKVQDMILRIRRLLEGANVKTKDMERDLEAEKKDLMQQSQDLRARLKTLQKATNRFGVHIIEAKDLVDPFCMVEVSAGDKIVRTPVSQSKNPRYKTLAFFPVEDQLTLRLKSKNGKEQARAIITVNKNKMGEPEWYPLVNTLREPRGSVCIAIYPGHTERYIFMEDEDKIQRQATMTTQEMQQETIDGDGEVAGTERKLWPGEEMVLAEAAREAAAENRPVGSRLTGALLTWMFMIASFSRRRDIINDPGPSILDSLDLAEESPASPPTVQRAPSSIRLSTNYLHREAQTDMHMKDVEDLESQIDLLRGKLSDATGEIEAAKAEAEQQRLAANEARANAERVLSEYVLSSSQQQKTVVTPKSGESGGAGQTPEDWAPTETTSPTASRPGSPKTGKKKEPKPMTQSKNAVYVPKGFRDLLVTAPKVKKGATKTKKLLFSIINQIYMQKHEADLVDDRENNFRQTLPEFVFEFFVNKYGLRHLAEKHIIELLGSVSAYQSYSKLAHRRLKMFGRFCELFSPSTQNLNLAAMNVFIDSYAYCHNYGYTKEQKRKLVGDSEDIEQVTWVPLVRALEVIKKFLYAGEEENVALRQIAAVRVKLEEALAVSPYGQPIGLSSISEEGRPVDVDLLLEIMMDAWEEQTKAQERLMEPLFKKADFDGDGQLSLDEFYSVMKTLNPDFTDRELTRMYTAGVRATGADTLDAKSFVQVAKIHGLVFKSSESDLPPADMHDDSKVSLQEFVHRRSLTLDRHKQIQSTVLDAMQSKASQEKDLQEEAKVILLDAWEEYGPMLEEEISALKGEINDEQKERYAKIAQELVDLKKKMFGEIEVAPNEDLWMAFRSLTRAVSQLRKVLNVDGPNVNLARRSWQHAFMRTQTMDPKSSTEDIENGVVLAEES